MKLKTIARQRSLDAESEGKVERVRQTFFAKAKNSKRNVPRAPLAAIPISLTGEIVATAELSEDAFAVIFASEQEGRLIFSPQCGDWYEWTGASWRKGAIHRVREAIRRLLRRMLPDGNPRWLTSRVVDSVERLARSDSRLLQTEPFDPDPWLLATPNKLVDLRTGQLRATCSKDMISRVAGVTPDFSAACPRWSMFLKTCTQDDAHMIDFLQRMCGYCLTGSTTLELVFLLYGPGSNGKSVFLRVLREIMQDYFVALPVDVFLQTMHDPHPTGLAHLDGARLAACAELPDNRVWNAQRIKDVASGERIAARYMRQDFFEFQPCCKLLFVGNRKPRLRQVDEAERRRFRLLPFVYRVPEKERDPNLQDALRAEYPAILAWMIEGARLVYADGIGLLPDAVRRASADYFAESDTLATWIDEAVTFDAALSSQSSVLYRAYCDWFDANGFEGRAVSTSDFKARLTLEYGARYEATRNGRLFRGVGLRIDLRTG